MKHRKIVDGLLYIDDIAHYMNKCYVCGDIRETRPYGENEQEICHVCAQLPQYYDTVVKNLSAAMDGNLVIVNTSYLPNSN